jgi:hypothetical protein
MVQCVMDIDLMLPKCVDVRFDANTRLESLRINSVMLQYVKNMDLMRLDVGLDANTWFELFCIDFMMLQCVIDVDLMLEMWDKMVIHGESF